MAGTGDCQGCHGEGEFGTVRVPAVRVRASVRLAAVRGPVRFVRERVSTPTIRSVRAVADSGSVSTAEATDWNRFSG